MRLNPDVRFSKFEITNAIVFQVVIFAFTSSLTGASSCMPCKGKDFTIMQNNCSSIMNRFNQAVIDKKEAVECSTCCVLLEELYFCTGDVVPQCIENITRTYQSYHMTPYDCHISKTTREKLQHMRLGVKCTSDLPSTVTPVSATTITENQSKSSIDSHTEGYTNLGVRRGACVSSITSALLIWIAIKMCFMST